MLHFGQNKMQYLGLVYELISILRFKNVAELQKGTPINIYLPFCDAFMS